MTTDTEGMREAVHHTCVEAEGRWQATMAVEDSNGKLRCTECGRFTELDVSYDGLADVKADDRVYLWDVDTGELVVSADENAAFDAEEIR